MYKLIIGNVRITVSEDSIERDQAADAARKAISAAAQQGKALSHIEVYPGDDGPEVNVTEKTGYRAARKSIKQSLLDGILYAAREKLYPTGNFVNKDLWYDIDTGQEWRGEMGDEARKEIMTQLEVWLKTV